jgi:hypothetical protein
MNCYDWGPESDTPCGLNVYSQVSRAFPVILSCLEFNFTNSLQIPILSIYFQLISVDFILMLFVVGKNIPLVKNRR